MPLGGDFHPDLGKNGDSESDITTYRCPVDKAKSAYKVSFLYIRVCRDQP
jgi:hypothetical protein